jgi:hypothetical protein
MKRIKASRETYSSTAIQREDDFACPAGARVTLLRFGKPLPAPDEFQERKSELGFVDELPGKVLFP